MTEFEGIITSSFSTYGIVDEDIYFDYDVVQGELPSLGCKVRGVKELHGDDVYHAKLVEVINDVTLERCQVSGCLSRIEDDMGYVNDIPFKMDACSPRPSIGDLLSVLIEDINGVVIGTEVSHIRKRKFTSYVLRVTPTICTLEESTYFNRNVCPNGYNPQSNDIVCGFAVECSFKEYVWRAVEINPSSSTVYNVNAPLSLYRRPKFCLSKFARECERGDDGDLITCSPHALRVGHLNPGDTTVVTFILKNMSSNILVQLWSIAVLDSSIISFELPLPRYMYPQSSEELNIRFTNADIGQHITNIAFRFSVNDKYFQICRRLHVNVIPPRSKECLRARTDQPFLEGSVVIPGLKPERKNPRFYPNHFPSYSVPEDVTSTPDDPYLAAELSSTNYKIIMHKLLYIEEKFVEEEMNNFSIYETSLMKRGRFLVLKVPALVESKLSLLIGNTVILEHPDCSLKYQGYIHKVDEPTEEVMLGFDDSYHDTYSAENVNIHFVHSRTSFVRCHLAIDYILKQGLDILFPSTVNVKPPHFNINSLELFNKSLNPEQVSAVRHIIEGKARPLPYLLFGPPGTGKTVTIVETILQLYFLQEDSRILVAAPSNSACDLIAQRLLQHSDKLDMVRLNSLTRFINHLPEDLQRISMPVDEVKEASLKRIIIATCISAGNIYKLALRTTHFTHVFVDEAGQAIEPEVILPIALSTGPGTQAVLAGDPYQLGPVIRNPHCELLGLQISFLERLMDLDIYDRKEQFADNNFYDPILLTKLLRNYRSHPDLLVVPSHLFYENELIECGPKSLVNKAIENVNITLPNPNVPLIFHGLVGEEMKELNNPSTYNPTEIVQVLTYIKMFSKAGFHSSDIGVITPYRKQVEKTRMMLESIKDIESRDIKIASVEDFQGQERPVIIITTVRSNNSLPADKAKLLGFLQNPKRFNVAITRAQAMLIVVGNPDVLKHDEHWNALLEYAVSQNCYVGCEYDPV